MRCILSVLLKSAWLHNKGAGINTLVSAGKQECLHLFSFQNNEVYVAHAVQLVQFYIVFTHDMHLFMPHSLIHVVL